jgi:predicted phage-related endonuclease
MIINNCEQGSDLWFSLRCGNPGASSFDKIITSTGKPSTQAQKYLYQCAGELLTGQKAESYSNVHMTRGIELEAEARSLFEMIQGVEVKQVGLIYPDHTQDYHCSPDGLIDLTGLEIKCPSLPVAVEYLDKGVLPTEYKVQVHGSMMVTGFKTWWFISYYPGLKPLILEIHRDDKFCEMIKNYVDGFCSELKSLVEKLKAA